MQVYWSEGRLRKEHEERMNTLWNIVVSLYPGYNTGQHDVPEFLENFYGMLYDATDVQQ